MPNLSIKNNSGIIGFDTYKSLHNYLILYSFRPPVYDYGNRTISISYDDFWFWRKMALVAI